MTTRIHRKIESVSETKEDFVTYCNLVKKALMGMGYGNNVAKSLVGDHKNGIVRTYFNNRQDAEAVAKALDRYYANESYTSERRDDYLQEVWDSLEPAWDKSKFDMKQGYDSEYDCDCITITSKDNDGVLAKIYVNDYDGKHPVGFDVVYRYPGDKGVGVMGSYEFQSTDMDGLGEEVFDYFDEIKQKAAVASFESDLQDYADAVKAGKYDKQLVIDAGWSFEDSVEYGDDLVRDDFKKKYGGKTYLLRITFNSSTKDVSDVEWGISAVESKKSEASVEDLRNRSVSSGTLKSKDLVPKFLDALKTYGKDKYDAYIRENPEVEDWENLDDETMGWVVDELMDLLNEIAPDGCYFGASEGDGADFGFWSMSNESKKSEATRFGAGMSKRTDFTKVRNLGDILDVLKEHQEALEQASKDMSHSKDDITAILKKLDEFDGYVQVLKQQSIKGIKKALAIKNSPEVQAASEVETALKGALSIIADNYLSVTDIKALMTVIDSRYSTTGSRVLATVEGQVSHAIEVDYKTIKDSIASGDVSEDDVLTFATMTSVSHGVKDKGVATKLMPVLERMNTMVKSATRIEEAVIDPGQFKELRDYVEQLVKEASAPKDTIKTTIIALDKDTIASVPTESRVSEGLLDKIKDIVSTIRGKISNLWDKFKSAFFELEDDALESADVFAELEVELAMVGVTVAESRDRNTLGAKFEVLTKSVLTCCDTLAKDASLAGEFDDEVIYAEDTVKNAVESFRELGHACESLKHVLSCHKNEDNMNVIGILADAITQIVADDDTPDNEGGDTGDEEDADAMSVIDQVEQEYAPSEESDGGEKDTPAEF